MFVLALGVVTGFCVTGTVGASGEGTKPDRQSATELSANAKAVDPAVVIQAESDKNIADEYAPESRTIDPRRQLAKSIADSGYCR